MSEDIKKEFFGTGFFEWQYSNTDEKVWEERQDNEVLYWGDFSREPFDTHTYVTPDWSITGFKKYNRPVLAPSPDGWDCGHKGGGVHNGSVLFRNGQFYYIYRGEFPIPEEFHKVEGIGYMCDAGAAVSDDGIHFRKLTEYSPFLRCGGDERFSFEDINVVEYEGTYYMFLNRWDWTAMQDPSISGIFIATSKDLLHWEKKGLAFPDAKRIHRNPVVVQNPNNEAVRINGKFIMYINDGLMGMSDDLLHWDSVELEESWPGGEGCLAMTDYDDANPDNIVLFTGGHHTGHFYAVGEVLFKKADPTHPVEWLPRPVLTTEKQYPWENGLSADESDKVVSYWRDTIFFTGMTKHDNRWWAYYGGSEYYTCLAISDDIKL